jgi:hypothetical protein
MGVTNILQCSERECAKCVPSILSRALAKRWAPEKKLAQQQEAGPVADGCSWGGGAVLGFITGDFNSELCTGGSRQLPGDPIRVNTCTSVQNIGQSGKIQPYVRQSTF